MRLRLCWYLCLRLLLHALTVCAPLREGMRTAVGAMFVECDATDLLADMLKNKNDKQYFDGSVLSNVLHQMASEEQWNELEQLAIRAHTLRTADDLQDAHSSLAEVIARLTRALL